MPKCIIDGKEVEFINGENIVDAAKRVGIEIPVFCYHPGLSVVAQCRMCAVEIEKFPKIQTACSTKCVEGMVIKTTSENAKKARLSVMEFLLVNHPLDCPICDKSGECDLQDNSFKWGSPYYRSTEERRTYLDLDMGPVIKKNMNRCIHCTRCIRFGEEVAGIHEMVALKRGNSTEISTIDGKPLETEYAGCYSDICPTGSLTLKDFRFNKRVWMLKKTQSVCTGCSKGCNIEVQHEGNKIYRVVPRENLEINKYWMCDEGRFLYKDLQSAERALDPTVSGTVVTWTESVLAAKQELQNKKVLVLVGTDLTQEDVTAIQSWKESVLPDGKIFHFGTPGIDQVSKDGAADRILKMKSKTANLNGIESLGVKSFESSEEKIDSSTRVLVFQSGRAILPKEVSIKNAIVVGVLEKSQAVLTSVYLPATTSFEKEGTVINHQGKKQKIQRAIQPIGKVKQLSEILMLWLNLSLEKQKQKESAM